MNIEIQDRKLFNAVLKRDKRTIRRFIRNGANIHFQNSFPLREMSNMGRYDFVKYFVGKGANIHVNNDAEMFLWAVYRQNDNIPIKTFKFLVKKGKNIYAKNNIAYLTAIGIKNKYPLHTKFSKIIKFLENKGITRKEKNAWEYLK